MRAAKPLAIVFSAAGLLMLAVMMAVHLATGPATANRLGRLADTQERQLAAGRLHTAFLQAKALAAGWDADGEAMLLLNENVDAAGAALAGLERLATGAGGDTWVVLCGTVRQVLEGDYRPALEQLPASGDTAPLRQALEELLALTGDAHEMAAQETEHATYALQDRQTMLNVIMLALFLLTALPMAAALVFCILLKSTRRAAS